LNEHPRGIAAVELAQLFSFFQIFKTFTFSEASKRLFLSQSAVSHQIINLEKELKVKLFERIGKKVKLTEQGEILFDVTNKFVNELEDLNRIYADMRYGKGGRFVIATSSAVMAHVLPQVIRKFVDQFPKINIKLIACNFISEMQSLIMEGEVDLGIGVKSAQMPSQKLGFLHWKFFDTLLLTSKSHPLSKRKNIKLSDLAKYPHILYRKGTVMRRVVEEVFSRRELTFEIIMEMDMADNIKKYVDMGIGVGILSALTLTQEDKERFAIFNVTNIFGKVDIGIYISYSRYISTAMKEFIKLFAPELLEEMVFSSARKLDG
jgi:DNA-binding transcriptional LysR family regulator